MSKKILTLALTVLSEIYLYIIFIFITSTITFGSPTDMFIWKLENIFNSLVNLTNPQGIFIAIVVLVIGIIMFLINSYFLKRNKKLTLRFYKKTGIILGVLITIQYIFYLI